MFAALRQSGYVLDRSFCFQGRRRKECTE